LRHYPGFGAILLLNKPVYTYNLAINVYTVADFVMTPTQWIYSNPPIRMEINLPASGITFFIEKPYLSKKANVQFISISINRIGTQLVY
jgi:hypothetical protein